MYRGLMYLFVSGIISAAAMRWIWLPDPPPDARVRFFSTLAVGMIAGAAAGYLVHSGLNTNDELPAILTAVGAGTIFSAATGILMGKASR